VSKPSRKHAHGKTASADAMSEHMDTSRSRKVRIASLKYRPDRPGDILRSDVVHRDALMRVASEIHTQAVIEKPNVITLGQQMAQERTFYRIRPKDSASVRQTVD